MDTKELLAHLGPWQEGPGHRSVRLARAIATAVRDGLLSPGIQLPAERALAAALGVSRGTVARAYEQLRADGIAHARQGSGTFLGLAEDRTDRAAGLARSLAQRGISPPGGMSSPGGMSPPGSTSLPPGEAGPRGGGDRTRIDLRLAAWPADPRTRAALIEPIDATDRVLDGPGYWPLGLPALRSAIAERLSGQGLATEPEQVLLTAGAHQAIDVALTTVAGPSDTVLVPQITYPGVPQLLALRGLRPLALQRDRTGQLDQIALLGQLRDGRSSVAYLIPSIDNPTGLVLPAPTRRLVVEAAASSGTVLLEDLTLAELWTDTPPPPALTATPGADRGRVVTVGSLSKVAWSGLRLGWIRAEGPLLERLARVRTAADLGASVLGQLASLRVLDHLDAVVESRRGRLRRLHAVLRRELSVRVPEWRVLPAEGGLCAWVELGGVSSDEFVADAAAHGLDLSPGRVHHALGRDPGGLRLALPPDEASLEQALERLTAAWRTHLERTAGSARLPTV